MEKWWETREITFRDQFWARHLPLVSRVCRRVQRLGEPQDALIQAGAIGLIKATSMNSGRMVLVGGDALVRPSKDHHSYPNPQRITWIPRQ